MQGFYIYFLIPAQRHVAWKAFSLLNPALAKIFWMNYNYIRYTLHCRIAATYLQLTLKKGREIAVFVENIKLHTTRAILSKSLLLLYSRRSHKWRTQDIECTQAFLSKPTLVLLQMRFNHIKMLQVISHAVSYLQSRQPYIQGASCAFNWISNKFKWQRKLWNKKGALPPKYSKHRELQSRMASRLFDLSLFFYGVRKLTLRAC